MNWYSIKNEADSTPEIVIDGEIGWEVTSKEFQNELKQLGVVPEIDVYINSVGGSVIQGMGVYHALNRNSAKIRVKVEGVAASIASVIAMAGDTVEIATGSLFMIHNPSGFAVGEAKDMRKTAEILDKMRDQLVSIYETRNLSLTTDQLIAAIDDETWMDAEEAVEFGFADAIEGEVDALEASAHFDFTCFQNTPKNIEKVRAALDTKRKNKSTTGSSAAVQTKGTIMELKFTQAEHDSAIQTAKNEATQEAEAKAATDNQADINAVHDRYAAILGETITESALTLIKSNLSAAECKTIMGDQSPIIASKKEPEEPAAKGTSPDDVLSALKAAGIQMDPNAITTITDSLAPKSTTDKAAGMPDFLKYAKSMYGGDQIGVQNEGAK